eukprot:TRINITY_DN4202_c0_g1_i3.p1 TRINITY_DN4202_c0_g1~~TRINITY_DN4202_c0_g1_i3.p1  ORF type:complete len:782 (-),score=199.72 TRINITY_DN4202_c0_g1_i3:517-2862(-)
MNLLKLGLQFILLLSVINVAFGSPFKLFKRQSLPFMGEGGNSMTRVRGGRNSKVMLFNHENGPKTVSPISLKDETTTEIAKEDAEIQDETSTANIDPAETTTKEKVDVDDTFQALLGLNEDTVKEDIQSEEAPEEMNVGELLADLEKAIAKVDADYEADLEQIEKRPLKGIESEDIGMVENDLADELIAESLQKERLPKDVESKFDIEHNFSLDDDIQEDARSANPQANSLRKGDVELAESPILQIKQQPTPLKRQAIQPNIPQPLPQQQTFNSVNPASNEQSQFQVPQQGFNNQNQFQNQQNQGYNPQNNFPAQVQQPGFVNKNPYRNQQYSNSQQQQIYNQNQAPNVNQQQRFNNQNQFSQGFNGQNQFNTNQQFGNQPQFQQSQATPRQIEEGQERATLLSTFGDAMGTDANVDPGRNQFSTQPQLNPRQQAAEDNSPQVEDQKADDEEVRCINKVMQVEETVYEHRIKCQHTFTEKCHDTYITDYIPTQERKCETSFQKNCHITYKPMMFEETVEICNEPLRKVCNNETEGKGEEICKTHYETNCETRFKEHEVEQDEPVCKMVIERKCNDVRVPVPGSTGFLRRKRRQAVDDNGVPALNDDSGLPALSDDSGLGPGGDFPAIDGNQLEALSDNDLLSIGEECEEWPVQKCTLEKKLVKKVNPETSCQKMPREICAPGNCIVQKADKTCRKENKSLVQNIPTEDCDLEPQENCKMETVLVPRLIQQPNCIKVPKEICINAKSNPKKVKKPVVKEWCYKPSDLKSPSTRLALSQFFSN